MKMKKLLSLLLSLTLCLGLLAGCGVCQQICPFDAFQEV